MGLLIGEKAHFSILCARGKHFRVSAERQAQNGSFHDHEIVLQYPCLQKELDSDF
jgi:hypothetical protein